MLNNKKDVFEAFRDRKHPTDPDEIICYVEIETFEGRWERVPVFARATRGQVGQILLSIMGDNEVEFKNMPGKVVSIAYRAD